MVVILESRQFRLVGFAFTGFGIFLALLGLFAYFLEGAFRGYTFGLLILGGLVVTVSQIVAWWRKE
ncbi:MAG: hypothetical protein ACE5KD_02600 [Candidatus Bathyarchaeia archaeon]